MAGLNSLAEAAPILLMLMQKLPRSPNWILSGQQLLPHAIHGHGEDGNDIRTLVHAAMTGYMLGKAVDVHHFRILRTLCVRFLATVLFGRIATHHDTVVNHKLKL